MPRGKSESKIVESAVLHDSSEEQQDQTLAAMHTEQGSGQVFATVSESKKKQAQLTMDRRRKCRNNVI